MIYITRHGETDWNVEGRCAGRTDIELNGTGIEQAKEIKEKLAGIKFDKVFSSPLKRSYQTAKIISNIDITIDDRLIERCNGQLEGKLRSDAPKDINFNDPNVGYGIESIIDFRKRIEDFCKELEENYKNKNVLVVTHAGVSIYIKCYFEGEPKDGNYSKFRLKNCEILEYNNKE